MVLSNVGTTYKQAFLQRSLIHPFGRSRADQPRLTHTKRNLAASTFKATTSQALMSDIEEPPAFCIPCEGAFVGGCSWQNGTCFDGECEGLHLSVQERHQHEAWPRQEQQKVIVTAGPERSGSTWLFNAVRLLLKHTQIPYDPYWITSLSPQKLQQRKQFAQGKHVVIKTHCWSDAWDVSQADHIFLTHRDLQGVVASYRRVGWAFNISDSYVQEHQQWRAVAQRDVAYENIMSRPVTELQALAEALGISQQVNVEEVNAELRSLKPASRGAPDPVSKLWPGHYSAEVQRKHDAGCSPLADDEPAENSSHGKKQSAQSGTNQLKSRFPEYFRQYGYG